MITPPLAEGATRLVRVEWDCCAGTRLGVVLELVVLVGNKVVLCVDVILIGITIS